MSLLDLKDNGYTACVKLSQGNPGAATAIVLLLKHAGDIDKDSALGGIGSLLQLDQLGIYGSRIWMLYSDVCNRSLPKMVALLRAVQLGILDTATLQHGIDNYGRGLDVDGVLEMVKKELRGFDDTVAASS
jgi:hypothetical protein